MRSKPSAILDGLKYFEWKNIIECGLETYHVKSPIVATEILVSQNPVFRFTLLGSGLYFQSFAPGKGVPTSAKSEPLTASGDSAYRRNPTMDARYTSLFSLDSN